MSRTDSLESELEVRIEEFLIKVRSNGYSSDDFRDVFIGYK